MENPCNFGGFLHGKVDIHKVSKSFPQVINKIWITFLNVENVDNLWIKLFSSLLYRNM